MYATKNFTKAPGAAAWLLVWRKPHIMMEHTGGGGGLRPNRQGGGQCPVAGTPRPREARAVPPTGAVRALQSFIAHLTGSKGRVL